jgi:hypothetical protein
LIGLSILLFSAALTPHVKVLGDNVDELYFESVPLKNAEYVREVSGIFAY